MPGLVQRFTAAYYESPPTTSEGTLKQWSSKFKWAERAVAFDADWDRIRTAEREAELAYGLALDYQRVKKLKRLADFLEDQIYAVVEITEPGSDTSKRVHPNVWVHDVKQIGGGEDAEKVDIERFNSALFTQYRETLNDLAKETGGRIQKSQTDATIQGSVDVTYRVDPEQYQRALTALADALGTIVSTPHP